MREFIRTKGVTACPPRTAAGAVWYKPTASGSSRDETEWLMSHKPSAKCNEENLAKAKILTMMQDLGGRTMGCTPSEKNLTQSAAFRFFFDPRERRELEAWCDSAGYDPDYIREQAQKIRDNGLPRWRAAAGEGKTYQKRKKYRDKQKALRP